MESNFWLEVARPALAALLVPPTPLFFFIAAGLALFRKRPAVAAAVTAGSALLLWLCSTVGLAQALTPALLEPPPVLDQARIEHLRNSQAQNPTSAIIVLGSGIFQSAPEYQGPNLTSHSIERLRYGIWLSRSTGIPVGFSGGVGWAGEPGASEAQTARQIAETEFGHPLRWVEDQSRDTLENARFSVAMLRGSGVRHIIVVSSAFQARRALRAFNTAAAGSDLTFEPAPINAALRLDSPIHNWIPTPYGAGLVPTIFREWAAYISGA